MCAAVDNTGLFEYWHTPIIPLKQSIVNHTRFNLVYILLFIFFDNKMITRWTYGKKIIISY